MTVRKTITSHEWIHVDDAEIKTEITQKGTVVSIDIVTVGGRKELRFGFKVDGSGRENFTKAIVALAEELQQQELVEECERCGEPMEEGFCENVRWCNAADDLADEVEYEKEDC